MSEERDRRVLRHYAAANAALDEAPAEHTRAAILASAARAAGARPELLGRRRRWRLPLAAAASLLVGTMAVLLATRLDETSPEATTAAPPSAPVAMAPPAAEPAATEKAEAPAPAAKFADADEATQPATVAGSVRKQRPAAQAAPARDLARLDSAAPAAPAALAEKVAPPEAGVTAAAESAAGKRAEVADARARNAPLSARRAHEEAAAGSSLSADAGGGKATPWRTSPDAWVEQIVKLRRDGKHDEADAELALLRARHPQLRLPPAVLPPSGR